MLGWGFYGRIGSSSGEGVSQSYVDAQIATVQAAADAAQTTANDAAAAVTAATDAAAAATDAAAAASTAAADALSVAEQAADDASNALWPYRWSGGDVGVLTMNEEDLQDSDLGAMAWQYDMERAWRLVSRSPIAWAPVPDTRIRAWRSSFSRSAFTTINAGVGYGVSPGTSSSVTSDGSTKSLQLERTRISTTSTAGTVARCTANNNGAAIAPGGGALGYRFVFDFVLSGLTATAAMFVGITGTYITGTAANFAGFVNCLAVGRNASDPYLAWVHNDGAGGINYTSLGADFPVGADLGYRLEIYKPRADYAAMQLTALNSGKAVSQSFDTEIPTTTSYSNNGWMIYLTNGTDAQIATLDVGDLLMGYLE